MADIAAVANPPPEATSSPKNDANDYIHTTTHNYISRQATVDGARQVELKGRCILKAGVHFHGDSAVIRVGRYGRFDTGVVVLPPTMPGDASSFIPPTIGAKTWLGAGTHSQAAAIGSLCWIGQNVTLGPRVILKDCVVVADGTVIPADTVIPPFSHIRHGHDDSSKRLIRTELPPASAHALEEQAMEYYQVFDAERGQK